MGEPPKGCLRGRVEEVFRRGNAQAEVLKSKWGLADSVVGDSRQKKEHIQSTERERGRSSIEMTAIGLLAWTTDSKKKMIYLQMCMGQTEKSLEALLAIKDVKIARMHPLHIMC